MNHTCAECGREFKNRRGLSTHFGRTHKEKIPPVSLDPQEYPFPCQICNTRRFKSQRGLSNHMLKTHSVKFELSKEERTQRQTEIMRRFNIRKRKAQPQVYKHKCPMCEFRAINKGGLSSHMTKMHPERIHFSHPVHVGFSESDTPKKSTLYDEDTLEWLGLQSDKNLLEFYLSSNNGTTKALVPSLRRNKIIGSGWRQRKGKYKSLTMYGEKLLCELQEEDRVKKGISARIIAGEIK